MTLKLKLAELPATGAVPSGFPLSEKARSVMAVAGFPVPLTVTVNPVRVTGDALGLLIINIIDGTLEAPGAWVLSAGGFETTCIVTWVGVKLGVEVADRVAVAVGLFVRVSVMEGVGLLVEVEDEVTVAV